MFQVIAQNDKYMSEASNHVQFHITNVDYELRVTMRNVSSSNVTLTWNTVEGIDGYIVSHDQPENGYLMGDVKKNTSESSVIGKCLY